jgi:hypothetical protein
VLRRGVEVHHGVVVAVQVEHHVGVDGQSQQMGAQLLQLAALRLLGQRLVQRRAQAPQVLGRRVAQAHQLGGARRQIGVKAVEVLPRGQLVAPLHAAPDLLRQADRVAGRQQHDLAAQPALRLQLGEPAAQLLRHQHGRDLVGVQAGLQQRAAAAAGAEMQARDLPGDADAGAAQGVVVDLHQRSFFSFSGRAS